MQNLTHKLCESSSLDQLNCILCISRNINNSQNLSCKCFKSLQQLLLFTVKKCLSICVHTHTYTQGNYFSSSAITLSASCANARIIMTSLATKTKKKYVSLYFCLDMFVYWCFRFIACSHPSQVRFNSKMLQDVLLQVGFRWLFDLVLVLNYLLPVL